MSMEKEVGTTEKGGIKREKNMFSREEESSVIVK